MPDLLSLIGCRFKNALNCSFLFNLFLQSFKLYKRKYAKRGFDNEKCKQTLIRMVRTCSENAGCSAIKDDFVEMRGGKGQP